MHPNLGTPILIAIALTSVFFPAGADSPSKSLHSPSAQFQIHFEALNQSESFQHLVVKLETGSGMIDISEKVLEPIRCKDQSPSPEILYVSDPRLHHRHFSFQVEWRCGELLYHAKIGMGLDPQALKGPFQIAPHLFSVTEANSCTNSLSQ